MRADVAHCVYTALPASFGVFSILYSHFVITLYLTDVRHHCANPKVHTVVILWLQGERANPPLHSKAFHTWMPGEGPLSHSQMQHS